MSEMTLTKLKAISHTPSKFDHVHYIFCKLLNSSALAAASLLVHVILTLLSSLLILLSS